MKSVTALIVVSMLSGCTTLASVDAAIQKSAPAACDAAKTLYTGFSSSGIGSDRTKATVNAAYTAIANLCVNPSTITATQLATVAAQTVVIVREIRKAKSSG